MMNRNELNERELEMVCGGAADAVKNPLTDEEMDILKKAVDGEGKDGGGFGIPEEIVKKLTEIGVDLLDKSYKEIWDYFNSTGEAVPSGNGIGRMAY